MHIDGGYGCNYLELTGHMRGCETYPKCAKRERKRKADGK